MSLRDFLIGLAVVAAAVAAMEFITNPFAGENIFFTLGGVAGKIGGGVVLGLIIWAPLRLIRGSERAPDARKVVLYTTAILVMVIYAHRVWFGTPLYETDRSEFMVGVEKTCFPTQRAASENSALTDDRLRQYCSCVGSRLSTEVTEEEIKWAAANGSFPGSLQEKAQRVAQYCGEQLMN